MSSNPGELMFDHGQAQSAIDHVDDESSAWFNSHAAALLREVGYR
ncbi:MAG: hypothetical protein VCB77_12020 [Alphaproteobacteria bacterium]